MHFMPRPSVISIPLKMNPPRITLNIIPRIKISSIQRVSHEHIVSPLYRRLCGEKLCFQMIKIIIKATGYKQSKLTKRTFSEIIDERFIRSTKTALLSKLKLHVASACRVLGFLSNHRTLPWDANKLVLALQIEDLIGYCN